jgi:acyl-CoA synthetase (AMP-forming)/AMP-acid ligase II
MAEAVRPPDILSLHARATPDKLAVVHDRPDGKVLTWTFAQLEAQANRLANALQGLGLRRGEKLVWCGQNSPGVVRVVHAARKLGAVAVPLNYRLSPEEAQYVVDNSDAVMIYADAEYAPLFAKIRPETPKVREIVIYDGAPLANMRDGDALVAAASAADPAVDAAAAEAAQTMIYTSGTTGKPKGAVRGVAGSAAQSGALLGMIGYTPNDVYLTTGPLYHSGPGGFMAVAHGLGNTVVLQKKFDAEDWLRLVEKYRVSTTFSAPTPVRLVCNLSPAIKAKYDKTSMRRFIANAAPWSFALKQMYLADFPQDSLFEIYGSTELGVNTVLRPEDQLRKPGSCGKPAPMVEIKLFDDDGKEVTEPRVPGELAVRSPGVFDTYHKAREKFDEDTRGDYHTVGDVAYFDEEGYYYICDRKKDMIISGGVNIYPAEIEAVLYAHPQILDAAVFGIPDDEWGERVHAIVQAKDGETVDLAELQAFVETRLARYKQPRGYELRDALPRTDSGKLLKRVLRDEYWRDRDSAV